MMTIQQLPYAIVISEMGSFNKASEILYISQPSLTSAVQELEKEIGIHIFHRGGRGITLTGDGEEFIQYARQVVSQYDHLMDRYGRRSAVKKKFGISTQHYSFVVEAFVKLVKLYGMDEYDLAVKETKTNEIISDVKDFRSEMGILYENDFNKKVLEKIFAENGLSFHPLLTAVSMSICGRDIPCQEKKK